MNTQWKTIRVFISSTFRDMQSERDHLVRKTFPKIREELFALGVNFVDIDLRWGVTGEQDALDVCREFIDQSRPYFLCILGGRYGWIPEGEEKSITADEVHYAVLDGTKELNQNAFFYFRCPESTQQIIEEYPGQYREHPGSDDERKLQQLKTEISNAGYQPYIFSPDWNEERRRFNKLKQFGEKVYSDLIGAIKSDLAQADSAVQSEPSAIQMGDFSPFENAHLKKFVLGSRATLLDEVIEYVKSPNTETPFCLFGELGIGKSAFLSNLASDLDKADRPNFTVVRYYVGLHPEELDLDSIWSSLFLYLNALLGETKSEKDMPSYWMRSDHMKELIERFNKKHPESPLLFLFDGLENSRSKLLGHRDFVHNFSPAKLVFTLRIGTELDEFNEFGSNMQFAEVLPLSLDDRRAVTRRFLGLYHKTFTTEQTERFISKLGAQNPLWLINSLEQLRTFGTYEEITRKIDEIPVLSLIHI